VLEVGAAGGGEGEDEIPPDEAAGGDEVLRYAGDEIGLGEDAGAVEAGWLWNTGALPDAGEGFAFGLFG
jgi:hypothetical protein